MCGHVGIAGDLGYKDEAVLKRLLMFDVFRGIDSTGLASIRKSGEVKIAKIASHPIDLFDTKRFQDALSGWVSTVLMGHNRAATRGAINNLNAHPWQFGNIVGCHNGTLEQASWKELEEELGEKFEVDSMALIAAIDKLGVKKAISMIRGAWALVWYDLAEGTLNFLRNKERPFWYAYSDDFKRLLWASEHPTIAAAIYGHDHIKLHADEKNYKYWQIKEDLWHSINIDDLAKGTKNVTFLVEEVKGKDPTPAASYSGGHSSPFPQHPSSGTTLVASSTPSGSPSGTTSTTTTPSKTNNVVEWPARKDAPFGGFLDEKEFSEIAKYGCSFCQADVEFLDVGIKVWKDKGVVLCRDCSGADERSPNRVYIAAEAY